ncbi:Gfo/Idh/MocA family oxidoreductase [Streptomyces sp. NPDC006552]|uniref:Gfo/Idh/MocA family protein n=1 Tax=Streptomyces sp. NPDC006552 TaxID=3157179 RepID=UPI0033BE5802
MTATSPSPTRVVVIGCGYAADFYLQCCAVRPELRVIGAFDANSGRLKRFTRHYKITAFGSLAQALASDCDIIINATSIESHYPVTKAALHAGRHVFSEKPVAMTMQEAQELWALAREAGLRLSSAPSTALGACANAVEEALASDLIGRPLMVYASLDDGMVYSMNHADWISPSGNPWPADDEFAAGAVLEHLGYQLTWLLRLFGGVTELAGATDVLVPTDMAADGLGPNSAHWTLTHGSGVVTRLSASGLAPRDYSLTIVGDAGVLTVEDVMRQDSLVTFQKTTPPGKCDVRLGYLGPREELVYAAPPAPYEDTHYIDFGAGVADLARSLRTGAALSLDEQFCLHALEITLAIVRTGRRVYQPSTWLSSSFGKASEGS